MKKEIASFFAGAAAVAFAVSLTAAAMASSGKVAFNQVNVDMLGKSVISKGDAQTTGSGAKVPSSITYTDENGGATTYLPARTICDLFDADIDWYAKTGTVELGGAEQGVTITIGTGDGVPTVEEAYAKYPTKPELGVKAGEFTEVDPATVDKSGATYGLLKDARIQSAYGFLGQRYSCQSNSYVVITVTNNGQATESVFVYREKTISMSSIEKFSIVKLDPGKTITRAFKVGDVTQLTRTLSMNIDHPGSQGDKSDITVSVDGYYINNK